MLSNTHGTAAAGIADTPVDVAQPGESPLKLTFSLDAGDGVAFILQGPASMIALARAMRPLSCVCFPLCSSLFFASVINLTRTTCGCRTRSCNFNFCLLILSNCSRNCSIGFCAPHIIRKPGTRSSLILHCLCAVSCTRASAFNDMLAICPS